jgi:hypothetical protein
LEKWLHIEEFITFSKVTFYTVRFERDLKKDEMSETDKFLNQFMDDPVYKHELNKILEFLRDLGEVDSAREWWFRHERNAQALPPNKRNRKRHKSFDSFPSNEYKLRLYCLRLSDSVVILFNGGLKTHYDPEKCPNVAPHFRNAQTFAKKINQKLKDKDFLLSGRNLRSDGELAFEY